MKFLIKHWIVAEVSDDICSVLLLTDLTRHRVLVFI